MSDFKPGDIVRLKSSPQKMVVESVAPEGVSADQVGKVRCVWIEDYGVPHSETYIAAVLELAEGEDPIKSEVLKRKPVKDTLFDKDDPALKGGG